ncbi:MAG: hypothetical protein GY701_11040 [Sulfitobacter sp.]|nr:hypothetical protein [Sulfitobacter sp.]
MTCGDARVAWTKPRVDFCYQCLPGGPLTPPPCSRCGSERYYNNGLCDACHPAGPRHTGSCQGCLAWGVTGKYRWRCWNCRWWHTHYIEGVCHYCGRRSIICEQRACRLCWEQARLHQEPGRNPDLASATRFGQQLFFANVTGSRATPHRHLEPPTPPGRRRSGGYLSPLPRLSRIERGLRFTPMPWQQQRLFDIDPDPHALIERAVAVTDSAMLGYCDEIIADHAAIHGWSPKQTNDVRRSLRLLHALQDTPGARINATDVLKLPSLGANLSAISTIDVLAAAGLLIDDRTSAIDRYFTRQIAGLPAPMCAQLRVWFDVMINGSATAPRRRPRDPRTTKLHIRAAAPILRIWAAHGHDTLAAIEPDDITAALPAPGPRRHLANQSLRSILGVLKARKQIFVDPTSTLPRTTTNTTIPVPLDTAAIRAALNSPDPAAALAVALVAFHALTSRQIRALALTDIVDGRLTIDDRIVPLAAPLLPRLTAWLDHRARTWPRTANPHLFINRRTAPRLIQVSRPFPWRQVNLSPQTLREDRILDEIRATDGDIVRVCKLFGLSVEAATRYATALDHTDTIVGGRQQAWSARRQRH